MNLWEKVHTCLKTPQAFHQLNPVLLTDDAWLTMVADDACFKLVAYDAWYKDAADRMISNGAW